MPAVVPNPVDSTSRSPKTSSRTGWAIRGSKLASDAMMRTTSSSAVLRELTIQPASA